MNADTLLDLEAESRPGPEVGSGFRYRRLVLVAVTAVAAIVVAGSVGLLASQLGTDPAIVRSPLIGKSAPAFELTAVDGTAVRSADLAGHPYVVNF